MVPLLSQLKLTNDQQEQLNLLLSGEILITAALPRLEKLQDKIEFHYPSIKVSTENGRIQLTGEIKHIPFIQHSGHVLLPIKNNSGGYSIALLKTSLEGVTVLAEESVDLGKSQGTILLIMFG